MSSLEERREARRRRRQQEEEEELNGVAITPEETYNIEKRRQEREERLQRIAAGFSTINGEDELERRRRERREQRLRSGASETPSEDTSSRRRRRRGTEDEVDSTPTEETESAPAPEPEPQVNAEEEENRRRQEEEEAERQRQAAEEARRRAQEEEDRRRREEEERQQREEEERRRREEEVFESESDSDMEEKEISLQRNREEQERKIDEQLKRLKTLAKNNDLLVEEDWHETSNKPVRRKHDELGKSISQKELERRSITDYSLSSEDGKCGKLKSFFEEKTEVNMNGDHQGLSKSLNFSKTHVINANDIAVFEAKVFSPGTSRLKDIQKKFEDKNNTENTCSRLGRLSVSETHLHEKPNSPKDNKKHILDRWQSAVETKKSPKQNSWLSKSISASYDFELNKKGENIERLSSKFDHNRNEKKDSFVRSSTLPFHTHKDMSSLKRQWSQNTDESKSNKSDIPEQKQTHRHSMPKVMERWLNKTQPSVETDFRIHSSRPEMRTRPASESYIEKNKENHLEHTFRPDDSQRKISSKMEEEERQERERLEAEEREREEAARIMEEQQKKKKGKRKGLGGLSPEKKKMLKDDEYSSSDDDEDDPYDTFLNERSKYWSPEKTRILQERIKRLRNLDSMSKGDLVKLCKELNSKLAQLEEEVYDWEVKIRKQDSEIIQLTLKVNDSKGKFAKPVLKKVNKTESKLNKIAKKDKSNFRDNLKSSRHDEDEKK